MAYVPRTQEEEETLGQAPVNPMLAGFGIPTAGGGGAVAATAPQQASSGFVPYSAYLGANQAGAASMAKGLASDVGKTAQGAQAATNAAREQFAGQVRAGSPFAPAAPTPGAALAGWFANTGGVSQATPGAPVARRAATPQRAAPIAQTTGYTDIGLGNSAQGGGAPVYGAGVTPEQARANAGKKYTGPNAIEDLASWKAAGVQTEAAQMELAQAGTDEGRQALLDRKYGTSGGGGRLNAALTGSAGSSQFDALRGQYAGLGAERKRLGAGAAQSVLDAERGTTTIAGQYADSLRDYESGEQWKKDRAPGGINAPAPGEPGGPKVDTTDLNHQIRDTGRDLTKTASDVLAFIPGVGLPLSALVKGGDAMSRKQQEYQDVIEQWNLDHPNGPTYLEAHPKASIFNPLGD